MAVVILSIQALWNLVVGRNNIAPFRHFETGFTLFLLEASKENTLKSIWRDCSFAIFSIAIIAGYWHYLLSVMKEDSFGSMALDQVRINRACSSWRTILSPCDHGCICRFEPFHLQCCVVSCLVKDCSDLHSFVNPVFFLWSCSICVVLCVTQESSSILLLLKMCSSLWRLQEHHLDL